MGAAEIASLIGIGLAALISELRRRKHARRWRAEEERLRSLFPDDHPESLPPARKRSMPPWDEPTTRKRRAR